MSRVKSLDVAGAAIAVGTGRWRQAGAKTHINPDNVQRGFRALYFVLLVPSTFHLIEGCAVSAPTEENQQAHTPIEPRNFLEKYPPFHH